MTALNLISDVVVPLKKSDRVALALRMMDENRVSHLPVVEDDHYLGLISEHELLAAEDDDNLVGRHCTALPKYYIPVHEHFYLALKTMCEHKLTLLPVLDENNEYIGVITGEILLSQLADAMSVDNPGGIIILDVHQNDYSLVEIARIVESNDTKILSTAVKTHPDSTVMQVTLKLNRINIEPVIQTFNRFQYDIHAYYGENEKDEELLRERYNALMSFLKI
ncbi:MAG: CBS domain-containing protein [Bacteroidales bacterium]